MLASESVGDLSGSIRRVVVNHQNARVCMRKDAGHDDRKVFALVVRWHQDERAHTSGLPGGLDSERATGGWDFLTAVALAEAVSPASCVSDCRRSALSNRKVEICSETRPTRKTITANISSNTAPLGIRE